MISSYINIKDVEDSSCGSENKEEKVIKKKRDRKPLIGSLSRGTFLSLSHTLRTYSALINHLLLDAKFVHALSGQMNNDRIERCFGLMRCSSGMRMALDTSRFVKIHVPFCYELCHNHAKIRMKVIKSYCANTFLKKLRNSPIHMKR